MHDNSFKIIIDEFIYVRIFLRIYIYYSVYSLQKPYEVIYHFYILLRHLLSSLPGIIELLSVRFGYLNIDLILNINKNNKK